MTTTRYLMSLFRALCVCLWTSTAFAIPLMLKEPRLYPLLTDPMVLAVSGLIAIAAGITTLAMRVNALLGAQDPANPAPMVKPWMFAFAHVGGSVLAALAALLLASMGKVDIDAALLGVLLASFAGAKFLEKLVEKYSPITRLIPDPKP